MAIVPAIAIELAVAREIQRLFIPLPEPGEVFFRTERIFPLVFTPFQAAARLRPEQSATLFAPAQVRGHEWTDIQPHAVVDVGLPAFGLLVQRLPPNEQVIGWLN